MTKKPKAHRITFDVTPAMFNYLEAKAKENGNCSLASVLRVIIAQAFREEKQL